MTTAARSDATLSGETNPLAGALCLFGFFLHILLSDPLLNAFGFHYSGEQGQFYEKIHPGTIFIFLSFAALLLRGKNPLATAYRIAHEQLAATALLVACILIFFYCTARSGAGGTAFLIDTHMTAPICAIVLCYTPASYCRRALHLFIAVAAINSAIGIAEALYKFRLFTFDADWPVLHETYFRSSALRGHPLNNAMFTSIALFAMLAMRYRAWLSAALAALAIVSLVTFGGRAALAFSSLALLIWLAATLKHTLAHKPLKPTQSLILLMMIVLTPLLLFCAVYGLIQTGIGERLAAAGFWDISAQSRQLAPLVLNDMKPDEVWFGIAPDQIMAITAQVNQYVPISDIENPWLLMFMGLGAVMFPIWLIATIAFIRWLLRGQSLAAKLVVLAYFITASTSNSFGRKDSTYLITVCAVTCLAQYRNITSPRRGEG